MQINGEGSDACKKRSVVGKQASRHNWCNPDHRRRTWKHTEPRKDDGKGRPVLGPMESGLFKLSHRDRVGEDSKGDVRHVPEANGIIGTSLLG